MKDQDLKGIHTRSSRSTIQELPSKPEVKLLSWIVIIIVLFAVGLIRYRLVGIPLERDEGEYAYGGQLVLEGKLPVRYIYSMKMPGIYYAYAVLMTFFGQTSEGIHAGLLIINLLNIVGIFLLAGRLITPVGAVIASVSFALLSMSRWTQGLSANTEHFVVLFATYGILILLRALSSGGNILLFVSGLLLGTGGMMKQHGFVFCVFAALYLIYEKYRQKKSGRTLFFQILWFAAGMLMMPALLIVPIIYRGQFGTFWFWTVTCSGVYVSQLSFSDILLNLYAGFLPILQFSVLIWILLVLGIFILFIRSVESSYRFFYIMFIVLSFLAICPGFYFRPHYFILLLPSVCLLTGLTASTIIERPFFGFTEKVRCGLLILVYILGIAQSVYSEFSYFFRMTPLQAARKMYGLNPFPETKEIAEYIKQHSKSSDTIAVLGSEPQIFFYAQRLSASPYIYMYPMMQPGPLALEMHKEFIRNVESRNPRHVVFVDVPTSWDHGEQSYNLIFQWFKEYKDRSLKIVGTVQLKKDESIYRWDSDAQWPPAETGWIALFESTP